MSRHRAGIWMPPISTGIAVVSPFLAPLALAACGKTRSCSCFWVAQRFTTCGKKIGEKRERYAFAHADAVLRKHARKRRAAGSGVQLPQHGASDTGGSSVAGDSGVAGGFVAGVVVAF